MGTWRVATFSDDLAADVRGDWREGILAGEDAEELTRRLVEQHLPANPPARLGQRSS